MEYRTLFLSAALCAASAQAAEPLAVAPAQYREVAETWSADGVVEAVRQSTVSAQISGRVKEILFDAGDAVRQGQVILRIDERESAQAVAGSRARLAQAQSDYERAKRLVAQKFISQAALDKAEADYKAAQAQSAQSDLAHGYTAVTAPYGGVVGARLVEVGEMVSPGTPLMSGFDPAQMRVVVDVPQYALPRLGARPQAEIELPASDRRVPAASVTLLPAADARTHSTRVRASLPSGVAGVYPGMFVRVHFAVGKANKLLIPASAVVRRSEVTAVYVVDEKGRARLRQVRLGEAAGQDGVEVLAGLNPGESVALNPVKAGMVQQAR